MAQQVALLPHRAGDPGLILTSGTFCVESAQKEERRHHLFDFHHSGEREVAECSDLGVCGDIAL